MVALTDVLQSIPLWMALLVTLAVLLYVYGTQPFKVWKELGVCGPQPRPFVGNVSEMTDIRSCIKKWQNTYGRMFGFYMFRIPSLVITDPEVLKDVFVKDFRNFTDRFLLGDLQQGIINKGVFFAKGGDWKRIRQIMSPIFSSRKLKLLVHHMNLTAKRLGGNMKEFAVDGIVVNAKTTFGDFTLDVVCGTTFGLDTNATENPEHPFIKHSKSVIDVQQWIQLMVALTGVLPVFGSLLKFLGIGFFRNSDLNFFEKNITALVEERKNQPQKNMDFLQLLIEAEAYSNDDYVGERKLSTEEIVAQGIIFIIASYETTSTTMQYLSYELAKNQDIQAKVLQEIHEVLGDNSEPNYENCKNLKYMEATIQETLRLHPTIHLLSRVTERTCNIKGVPIPANSAIFIPVGNIAHDPEFFPEPDSFRPDRFLDENKQKMIPFTFLSFGQGPRACIGMRLAVMEIKIALVHILRNVKLVDAKPDVLVIDDFTGVLVPKIPIELQVEPVKPISS